jgi:uncharacterized protein YutE (UPF0331/DUF86 family)/predicted nucleotidyltransferase
MVDQVAEAQCYAAGVIGRLRSILESEPRVTYAVLFGSRARERAHDHSDTDVAVGLLPGAKLSTNEIGDLVSRLEAAAGGPVDLVLLDEAAAGLAYRFFRDGRIILERDRKALVARKARAILEYLDFKPVEETFTRAVLQAGAFEEDRTAREIVILNLFVALQECVSLATHWLAEAGERVPGSYREIFLALAESGVLPAELARRLAAAAGFRNLVAHPYGVVEPARVHAMAITELNDLLEFCRVVSRRIAGP